MTAPGGAPSDAGAAFDDVLARIEALRSQTAARIATLGSTAPAPAPAVARPATPPPPAARPATPPPTPRVARPAAPRRPRRPSGDRWRVVRGTTTGMARALRAAAERSATVLTTATARTGTLITSSLRAARDHTRTLATALRTRAAALRTLATTTATALRPRISHAATVLRGTAATVVRGATAALAATSVALRGRIARLVAAAPGAARTVRTALGGLPGRVPARVVPVALVVLIVGAVGSLALRSSDDPGPDETAADTAAEVPDPTAPVAPILPPAAPAAPPAPEPVPDVAPAPESSPTPPPVVSSVRPPTLIRIPAIGVDASTVAVGLEVDGSMEIPSDVSTIGWYEPGPGVGVVPGQVGTAVLAGHVDSRTQGAGAFYSLRDLRVGDEIQIEHEDGSVTRWRVTSVTTYAKDQLPIDEVFIWEGPPRLALITCGGAFDWTVRSYTDNIVVKAEPFDVASAADPLVPS